MFFKVTSAAPDGNVFVRLAMAVEVENEEAAEQPHQVDFNVLVHNGNIGNFDQCDLEEAEILLKILMMTMLPHQRASPQLHQQIQYFKGVGIVVSAKERRMVTTICSHN